MSEQNAKIIAFVGLDGSGKSAATNYVIERGYPKVHFGSIIKNALDEEGLEFTLENERKMREKLRQNGQDLVVNRIVEQIKNLIDAGQRRIVVDGMGSWEAYRTLKHEFPGELITVALTPFRDIRLRRLANRNERPLSEHEAYERDFDEIESLGKGGVIAIADYSILNNSSQEQLHMQIDELMRFIDF